MRPLREARIIGTGALELTVADLDEGETILCLSGNVAVWLDPRL